MILYFWRSECTACLQTQALGLAQSGCAVAQQQVLNSHTCASSLLPYRLIRIPEKYQEASVPVCFTESSLSKKPWCCSSSGRVWEEAEPWSAAVPAQLVPSCGSGLQLPHPAPALGKPQSPPSRLVLVGWGVWRLDSKSFRVGACSVPQLTSGKQCFPVAGHQMVIMGETFSEPKVDSMKGFFDAIEFGILNWFCSKDTCRISRNFPKLSSLATAPHFVLSCLVSPAARTVWDEVMWERQFWELLSSEHGKWVGAVLQLVST